MLPMRSATAARPIEAMQPCGPRPKLPEEVATEPPEQAARDILLTAKETQRWGELCSDKQAAEALWIGPP